MALRRNVLQEDDILCELYAYTRSDVSDDSNNGSLDTDSDVSTTSSRKHLRSSSGPLTPTLSTPIFPHTLSGNRCESRWQVCHFSDDSQQTQGSGRLFKIWPVYEYCVQKFKSVRCPKQEMSLDEAMSPLRGRLKFTTYNPGKITKYGVLVRMVCEAVSGYICNMEVYAAVGKKLEDTVFSLLDRNLGQSRHIYQDNFYNSVNCVYCCNVLHSEI
jgi:hypothetical protein